MTEIALLYYTKCYIKSARGSKISGGFSVLSPIPMTTLEQGTGDFTVVPWPLVRTIIFPACNFEGLLLWSILPLLDTLRVSSGLDVDVTAVATCEGANLFHHITLRWVQYHVSPTLPGHIQLHTPHSTPLTTRLSLPSSHRDLGQ